MIKKEGGHRHRRQCTGEGGGGRTEALLKKLTPPREGRESVYNLIN